MSQTQIKAAEILLKKTAPDLSTVSLGQADDLAPIRITWAEK